MLNLPAYAFRTREQGGRAMIFDPVRRKYVRLTPEEWVRQHFVQFLIREQGVPAALVAIEMGFTYQGMGRRADVVVHDRRGRPLLMVECKAPSVEIRQAVFDQVARYNKVVQARYLVVTNGLVHYCYVPDYEAGAYHFLDALPAYEAL
ncbi:MAG: type I restriction enzyme HsdR N-terminal domain-containing protein [Rhodothermales bacterium]|nr:type I restriction enzyme HsdR N-terminal domain-containing protein [Rhodothermales bacterium]